MSTPVYVASGSHVSTAVSVDKRAGGPIRDRTVVAKADPGLSVCFSGPVD